MLSSFAVGLETLGPQLLGVLLLPAVQSCLPVGTDGTQLRLPFWAAGLPASARALTAMLCAALHRRHLMIWAVFAPKLLFEAASYVCVSLLLAVQRHTLSCSLAVRSAVHAPSP